MRRFIASLVALCLIVSQAWGGYLVNSYRQSTPASSSAISFLQCTEDDADLTTYTFSAENVGAAAADRYTIVGIVAEDAASSFSVSSVTVGGSSATEAVDQDGAGSLVNGAVYAVANPSGASEDIVVTFSEAVEHVAICVWRATAITSAVAIDSAEAFDTSGGSLTLDLDNEAVAVGMCVTESSSQTFTWTGLSERDDDGLIEAVGLASYSASDSTTAGTPRAVTCDPTGGGDVVGVTASFNDGGGGAGSTPTLTFLQCTADTTNQTTYTFAAQNTGTASATRSTIVTVYGEDSANVFSANTLTVGGDSATRIDGFDGAGVQQASAVFILSNTAGTSEDIVVTWSEAVSSTVICVWQADDLNAITAVDSVGDGTGGGAMTLDVDTTANSVTVGQCGVGSTGETFTWTGLTERDDSANAETASSAADFTENTSAATPLSVTCNGSGAAGGAGVAATFR